MALAKELEEQEKHGPPNETLLSDVMPLWCCGEGWYEKWRARIGGEYDENGLLKRRILYTYDDDKLVGEEIVWRSAANR